MGRLVTSLRRHRLRPNRRLRPAADATQRLRRHPSASCSPRRSGQSRNRHSGNGHSGHRPRKAAPGHCCPLATCAVRGGKEPSSWAPSSRISASSPNSSRSIVTRRGGFAPAESNDTTGGGMSIVKSAEMSRETSHQFLSHSPHHHARPRSLTENDLGHDGRWRSGGRLPPRCAPGRRARGEASRRDAPGLPAWRA